MECSSCEKSTVDFDKQASAAAFDVQLVVQWYTPHYNDDHDKKNEPAIALVDLSSR